MIRAVLILLCALALGAPTPSFAQKPASPLPAISAEQARAALDVLNDPNKRAAFAATLNAIVKASPGTRAEPAAAATPAGSLPAPLVPDGLGAQILLSASAFLDHLGTEAVNALEAVQSLPSLYGWAVWMATDPAERGILLDAAWRVALALACARAVEYGLRRAMRRPIRALEDLAPAGQPADDGDTAPENDGNGMARAEAGEIEPPLFQYSWPPAWTFFKRVPLVVARLLLELLPVLGIAVTGHVFAGSGLAGQAGGRSLILAAVNAYAAGAALLCVARMLLSPGESRLRLFQLPDSGAAYLMRWSRRLILIAVSGYAIGEAGLLLGLSGIAHDAFEKAVGLVLHLCLAFLVVRKRRVVRRALQAPAGATGWIARLRNRLAGIWHWIALSILIAGWLIWAVEVPHGYASVANYFVITAMALIGARLTLLLLLGLVDRTMQPEPPTADPYSGVQARLSAYHPVVTVALRLTVYLACILGLLQLYGLDTFLWLVESALGLRILSASGTLLVTVVLSVAVWEAVNIGVHRHLARLQREAQVTKSARLRTLLPLLRAALLIAIAVVAGLTILSEIGINIGPLLAGAGIAGVAIGFGSQKLVQDLITGLFLLLENAMQVGDTVTVAGMTGTVESLSVRMIRLRDADGSVHIIPFSSVTSVTNTNRGLGNASVSVSVAYEEDTDRVAYELKAIVDGMRADPALSAMMLSDFQLWGVETVDGARVTIDGQVVCTDAGRWPVQREFNRRMKRRFQELGIRIFNPVQTIGMPVPPPVERKDDRGQAQAAN